MIDITNALASLTPNAQWVLRIDKLEWLDTEQTEPTSDEIDAEVLRLQEEYDNLDWSRARKAKYDLLNQDEMRFDDTINSTTTWVDAINAIKAAHPKP
jgi:hypothetical protein|tara:strand:- start:47 stop:340 length:294 start_codon:yes stop_codon:yes gene_type:complete